MFQLSNDVCTFSPALFCQKLLVFLQVEVASSPRGFDDFENTLANNFWSAKATQKLRASVESLYIEDCKYVHEFAVALTVQKFLGLQQTLSSYANL